MHRVKPIAAICHAGQVLASAGIVKNRTLTCVAGIRDDMINAGAHYVDKSVVIDGNLVTSRVPSDLPRIRKSNDRGFPKASTLASSATKIEISKRNSDGKLSLLDLGRVITPKRVPL